MKEIKVLVMGSALIYLGLINFSYGMQKASTPSYLPVKSNVTKLYFLHVSIVIDYSNQNKGKYKKLSQTLKTKRSLNDINKFLRHNPNIDLVIANQLLHKLSFISYKDCKSLFQLIKYPDKYTYNTFIKAAGRNGEFKLAIQTFNDAKQKKQVNVVTYASFIDTAGKNGEFEQALQAFEEAKDYELANAVTYASFIDAAGRNGEFKQALQAFNDAKRYKLADAVTYASFINAAGKMVSLNKHYKHLMKLRMIN
ncbi:MULTISPECIES: hypothetical protein [Francisella]|nr:MULTISPECIES: hypothetical protein [Francisella]